MAAGTWISLIVVWIAAIVSPGPDVFLLMRLAIRQRRAAVHAALGIMTGNTIWVVASVLGLTALLSAVPDLTPMLQVLGSLVLAWVGVQSIRGGVRILRGAHPRGLSQLPDRPYALGFITNIANPKAVVFFTALLTQFLPPALSGADRVRIIAIMIGIGLAWFVGIAIACSVTRFRTWFGRFAPWLDIVAGVVFLLVSMAVLFEVLVGRLLG